MMKMNNDSCLLRAACRLLPAACCLLPAACCLLPAACWGLLVCASALADPPEDAAGARDSGEGTGESPESSPQAPDALPPAPSFHRVFIPIDKRRQPVGDKYYVPEGFYNELHRRAAALTEEPQGWLLVAATYRGVLSPQTTPQRLTLSELKAVFDLQVMGRTHVRIPLGREGANLLPDGALLDGRVVQPDWEEDGTALGFDVAEPGPCRLELSLRPTVRSDGPLDGFDLAIPRLATSRLELSLPAGAPPIEVPSAAGSITVDKDPPRLVAELGPADRLSVRWQGGARGGGAATAVDVEQLTWVRVSPGSVAVDAKFKFKIIEGRIHQVQLTADPRLRLLPPEGDDAPTARVHATPGQPQIVLLELANPVSDQVAVTASFILTGTSGVGNLRLPKLEAILGEGARTTKRWMAVSVAPELRYEQTGSDRLDKLPPGEFVAAWTDATGGQSQEKTPDFAYSLASGEPSWSMSTYPGEPRTSVDETLVLSFGPGSAAVRFDAQIVTKPGYNFQHRLSAPKELEIENISVLEEGAQRVGRWSRGQDGTITVFLTGPVSGKQELSLRGRLPTPSRGEIPLPLVRVEGGESKSLAIELFRQPAVMIEVRGQEAGVRGQEAGVREQGSGLGRHHSSFIIHHSSVPKVSLTLSPNRPEISARQVTSLRKDGESWEAEVDVRMVVKGGLVDDVCLDVPEEFAGPYKINPAATLQTAELPGSEKGTGARRRLLIRPRAAVNGEYHVSVSSPLTLTSGDRVSVPDIVLRRVDQPARVVVLPTQSQAQPVAWETRGLEETDLPEDLSPPPAARQSFTAYQVVGEHFQAVLRRPDSRAGKPRIHLADVSMAWRADATCHGLATFDLEPAGLSDATLYLPPGYRLVQVSVAEVPAMPIPRDKHHWRIPLGPRRLPQRVEVLFTGTLSGPASDGRQHFAAPKLVDLPVRRTLWTVSSPSHCKPGPTDRASTVTAPEQDLLRLQNVAAMIELAAEAPGEQSKDIIRWYRVWARRLAALRNRVRRQLSEATRTDSAREVRAKLQSIDRQQTRIASRLAAGDVFKQLSAEAPPTTAPDRLWSWTLDRPQPAVRLQFDDEASSIGLAYRQQGDGRLHYRLLCAAGLAVLAAGAVVGIRHGFWSGLLCRWPHTLGVAAGLAWWLWLSPGILGLGIVLVSLVTAVRWGWRSSRPASVIVPLNSGPR